MDELENKKRNLLVCKKAIKNLERKGTLYNIADSFAACAGAASVFGVFISPIAIVPLAAFIGLSVYITKKDEKNEKEICGLIAEETKLEHEIFAYSKFIKKETEANNKTLIKVINS